MRILIKEDYNEMSLATAGIILDAIRKKPNALLCLAAGDTPRLAYELLATSIREQNIDVSKCAFAALDEWVNIPPDNEGSCRYLLDTTLFRHLGTGFQQVRFFDSLAADLESECARMDQFIRTHGGIDLMVVGIGRNGHIGFNEPGVTFDKYSHVVDLDYTTTIVGQKYFNKVTTLTKGITLGLQHLMEAKQAVLIANGANKADVIARALQGKVDIAMPASIMQQHPNATIVLEKEAASLLVRSSVN